MKSADQKNREIWKTFGKILMIGAVIRALILRNLGSVFDFVVSLVVIYIFENKEESN